MLIPAIILFCLGLSLSAMFSGSEIGFYRIPRIRLKIDALDGDRTARIFLWLANHPSFFVAANLTGNNVANYGVSVSSVLIIQYFFGQGVLIKLLGGLILTPFLFVYGELFPKSLFLLAPNRMLYMVSPLMFFFIVLFLPITLVLWAINRVISLFFAKTHEPLRLSLARSELSRMLDEGHELGLLFDAQRKIAAGIFEAAKFRIESFAEPLEKYPSLPAGMPFFEALELARTFSTSEIPVSNEETTLIGYLRFVDMETAAAKAGAENGKKLEESVEVRPFVDISNEYSPLIAMSLFQSTEGTLGRILDQDEKTLGLLTAGRLQKLLLENPG